MIYIKPRKTIGRPTKYSEQIVREFERAFRIGMTEQKACYYVGVNPDTFYDWKKKKSEFSERIERAKLYMRIKASQIITKAIINDKDLKAAQWWLERKYRDEFNTKDTQEKNDHQVVINLVSYDN